MEILGLVIMRKSTWKAILEKLDPCHHELKDQEYDKRYGMKVKSPGIQVAPPTVKRKIKVG